MRFETVPVFLHRFVFEHFDLFFLLFFLMALAVLVASIGLLRRRNWGSSRSWPPRPSGVSSFAARGRPPPEGAASGGFVAHFVAPTCRVMIPPPFTGAHEPVATA